MTLLVSILAGLAVFGSISVAALIIYTAHRRRQFAEALDRAIAQKPAPYEPCLREREIAKINAARWDW